MIVSALSSTFDQNFTGNMREWRRREHSLVKTGLHQRKNFQPPPPKTKQDFLAPQFPTLFEPWISPSRLLTNRVFFKKGPQGEKKMHSVRVP